MANEIVMIEDEFDDISASLSNSYDNITNTGDGISNNFRGAISSGLVEKSTYKIGRQMSAISKSIGNVQDIIKKHSEEMFLYDNSVANKINEIEIPQDFIINDSSSINYYTQVMVAKLDGKSVNKGNATNKVDEIDESTINRINLNNIANDIDTNEQVYDDNTSISDAERLYNLSNGNDIQEINYNDDSTVEIEKLENINNGSPVESNYDDSTILRNQILNNINNNHIITSEESNI